jgi:hypothetical protein
MNCTEVFNIASDGLRQIWVPSLVGVALVALAIICLAVMYRSERVWFAWLLLVITLLLTMVAAAVPLTTYVRYRHALRSGKYETLEGRVERFTPMPPGGHAPERFTLRGEDFSYTDYSASPFFHKTAADGGPIHDRAYLKVAHVNGNIIRLQVCAKR